MSNADGSVHSVDIRLDTAGLRDVLLAVLNVVQTCILAWIAAETRRNGKHHPPS